MSHSELRNTQNGGKIIGQGEYGYAVYPALKCKDNAFVKRPDKVTSVITDTSLKVGKLTEFRDAKIEYDISQELVTIPGASQYFVIVDGLCEPAPRTEQTDKDVLSNENLKGKQLPLFTQILMPFGGRPLSSTPISTKYIDFMPLVQHLLEAGTLLLMKEIVHYDLHRANILLESKSKAKIIDFGVSWKPTELKRETIPPLATYFNANIVTEPPEVTIISGLLNKMTLETVLERVMRDKSPLKFYGILTNKSTDTIRRTLQKFINTSWCFDNENWLIFFQLYWSKMDSWAIGVAIMFLYHQLSMDPAFTESESYKKNKEMVRNVIDYLCTPDPGKRYDCARALSKWAPTSPILQQIDVQQWLEKETVVRKELEPILEKLNT